MKPKDVCVGRSRRAQSAILASVAILAFVLPAAARAATPEDPWEPANRTFYFVFKVIDGALGKAASYVKLVPTPIRVVIRNVIANLTEPGVAVNDLIQGHPGTTARTAVRFVVNTTIGIGGAP